MKLHSDMEQPQQNNNTGMWNSITYMSFSTTFRQHYQTSQTTTRIMSYSINFMKQNSLLQDIKQVSHMNTWITRNLVQKQQA